MGSPWIRTDVVANGWTRPLIEQHAVLTPSTPPLSDVTTEWVNLDSGTALLLVPVPRKKQFEHLNAFEMFHKAGTDVRKVTSTFLGAVDARYTLANLGYVHARCVEATEVRLSTF